MGPFCLEHEVTEAHLHDGKDLFSESYFFLFLLISSFCSPVFSLLRFLSFQKSITIIKCWEKEVKISNTKASAVITFANVQWPQFGGAGRALPANLSL